MSSEYKASRSFIRRQVRDVLDGEGEVKWAFGAPAAAAITTVAPFIGFFSGLTPGVAYNQRVGTEVSWKHFEFRTVASSFPGLLGDTQLRYAVLVDTAFDGAAAPAATATLFPAGIAVADYWRMPFDRNQVGPGRRFIIRHDSTHSLRPRTIATATNAAPTITSTLMPASDVQCIHVDMHGMHTQYNELVTGGPTDVIDRAVLFYAFTDAPAAYGPTFGITFTKTFKDV